MHRKIASCLAAVCLWLTVTAHAQTIVGFDFASGNLVPETLDSHLTVQDQTALTSFSFPAPPASFPPTATLLRINANNVDPMEFSFDVVIEPGYQLSLTGLFIGTESQKTPNTKTAALYYNTGSGEAKIASTEHTLPDIDSSTNKYADFADNSITLSGLTGTVTFTYRIGSNNPGIDYFYADEFNLLGSVTPIPEPGDYALIAGCLGLGALALRRRRRR